MTMRGIVFLDRDGTLIEDVGYLSDPALLAEIPGAAAALRRLSAAGFRLAVLSNQAGLAKGKFGPAQFEAVHRAFETYFRERGVVFDAVEYCPHHPDGVVAAYRKTCGCRKPGTEMAERVLERLAVPGESPRYMVGDKMIDVLLGRRLKARTVLVGTGYGARERENGSLQGEPPDIFLPGIREAAEWILTDRW